MDMINLLRQRAKETSARIILPEGEEPRIIKAAAFMSRERIANITLLGKRDNMLKALEEESADIDQIELIDILSSELLDEYTEKFYRLRKHKGLDEASARKMLCENPLYFGALMVRDNLADGYVGGAIHTTRDVARAALWCVGVDENIKTMSSSFIMILPDKSFGADGILIYADCGIVPDPLPKQLASITVSSSDLMKKLFGIEPRVAMLSFSTKGSGKMPQTEKIIEAIKIVKELRPELLIDGELQADAALVPEVADIKAPQSPLKGKANVLIFPNLEAGNISYKLTQRLAKARALGPLLQGLRVPCSDLSRGCSWEDVVDIVAVTALRCECKRPLMQQK